MNEPEKKPEPLFKIPFSIGEVIPLKGVKFRVIGVTPEHHIILAGEGFTNKFLKGVKKPS